jgi:hypothetical protein
MLNQKRVVNMKRKRRLKMGSGADQTREEREKDRDSAWVCIECSGTNIIDISKIGKHIICIAACKHCGHSQDISKVLYEMIMKNKRCSTTTQPSGGSTPSQYALPKGAKELQDLIEHRNMNFALGNIFKAVYRLGTCNHATILYDLNKIVYFAEREIKRITEGGDK